MKCSDIKRVAEMNSECISFEDTYSDYDWLLSQVRKQNLAIILARVDGEISGYLIYRVCSEHIESVRRGVSGKFRRRGVGTKLSKKLIAVSTRLKKPIYTYVSKSNLKSLNGNLKVGYLIDWIDPEWVYIKYTPKNMNKSRVIVDG